MNVQIKKLGRALFDSKRTAIKASKFVGPVFRRLLTHLYLSLLIQKTTARKVVANGFCVVNV